MSTLTDLKTAIDQDRDNYARYLVYADCLEENGFDDLAFAWRWMGKKHKRPCYRIGIKVRKRWTWNYHISNQQLDGTDRPEHSLVLNILAAAIGPNAYWFGVRFIYNTEDEAIQALAEGLKKLREALG